MTDSGIEQIVRPVGSNEPTGRAAFYVDGFNFYHALADLPDHQNYLKWVDWRALAKRVAGPELDVQQIVLCTAPPKHKSDEVQERHRYYMDALKSVGVDIREGSFISEDMTCRNCSSTWPRFNEKEGDVSLGSGPFTRLDAV